MQEFEVLLVSIDWESPDKVRAIIPSKKFLKASSSNGNKYEYDIVLYTKENGLYFQFAIKTKFTPFLKSNEGKWNQATPLYNIQDDLWIIKDEWRIGQRGIGYHYCPSVNTSGKIEIGLRDSSKMPHYITLDINCNIDDFDFSELKNDFEGELWNLITSNKSQVCSDKIEIRYCDKIFRYPENKSIIEFLKAFDQIGKNPKRELSSTKEIRRIEKVIPITETYRKLSTVGAATLLPSKAVLENHDIFENRYACFMLHRIHFIISNNLKNTSRQIDGLEKKIKKLQEEIIILQDPDPKVNAEIVKQEILFQEQKVNRLQGEWTAISNQLTFNPRASFAQIKVKIIYSNNFESNSYWCSTENTPYCLVSCPESVMNYIEKSKEFIIEVSYLRCDPVKTATEKTYPKFEITDVRKIESAVVQLEKNILSRQKQNIIALENNNWSQLSILNPQEQIKFRAERINQVQTLNKKIKTLTEQIKKISEFNLEHEKLDPLIKQKLRTDFFKKIKWKHLQGFKPSMTFIQNIAYRNALRYYKEILKSEGIDIAIFDLYENVTSYGLREMPQVYELWCLVTQIKILEESFHFKHSKNDIKTLLKNIDPKKQTIVEYSKISFENSLAGRKVILHYQKKITDNKRPDFILEVSCNNRKINLVLDSKFKNYNYKESIIRETIAMKDKYGEDSNYVFILHPCKDGTSEGRNIKYTNHGGERIVYGEETKFPFHEYGYIELKPNFTDTLKKLIAMSFEYLLEPSRVAEDKNPKPENEMFCINCGNDKFDIQEGSYKSGGKYYKYTCLAEDNKHNKICVHEVNISYCWNCKTKLFKHGSYWDYHLESTWSTSDIRCPNCGMTLTDRPQPNL
jgi:DNA-directed RNA polymerase subunit RPC12/RpoP